MPAACSAETSCAPPGSAITRSGVARRDLDITDADAVDAPWPTRARTRWSTAPPSPTSTAPRPARGACASTPRAPACRAAAAPARRSHPSTDYVFDGSGHAPTSSPTRRTPLSVYGESKLAGEMAPTSTPATSRAHLWLFGTGGRNFVETMLELGSEQSGTARRRPGRRPTYTGHLAVACCASPRPSLRPAPHGRRRAVLLVRVRAGDLRRRGGRLPRPVDHRRVRAPAPRPAWSVLDSVAGRDLSSRLAHGPEAT